MSFADLLRQSRSSPKTVLHKFLTQYDPKTPRVYAFVEGDPDSAFYRAHIQNYVANPSEIFVYKCEGKARVYDTYRTILARHPQCTRVLFFVDKDLDDILGNPWPADPRIFVTDCYSIENYLVCKDVVLRFFSDFVKVRRVDVDLAGLMAQFDLQLQRFHRLVLPIMAWIIAMRRAGHEVNLTQVSMGFLYVFGEEGVARKSGRGAVAYLGRVTQTGPSQNLWREIRKVSKELKRLPAKRYVRGKFEAWWLIGFIRKVTADLDRVVSESDGSISVNAQLQESNFVQLLARGLQTPTALDTFLSFHLKRDALESKRTKKEKPASLSSILTRSLKRLLKRR